MTLEINLPINSVLALQPIPVKLKLTNRNERTALGYRTIGFGKSPVYLNVRKVGTERSVPITMLEPLLKLTQYTNVPVEPQATVESKDLLSLGLARNFPDPGNYEIHATLSNSDYTEHIESNKVSLTIQEPTGNNRLAYNLITTRSFEEFLFSGAEFSKVMNTLEELTVLYPNSPYARDASFVLGENYFYQRNYSQALVHLLRLESATDFMYSDRVRNYLTEIRRVAASPTGLEKSEIKKPQ